MHAQKFPFAVRLLGFPPAERAHLGATLAQAPRWGPSYSCLLDDSLQEPDLTIANGEDLGALATLSRIGPGPLQPAVIVGPAAVALPFPQLARPVEPPRMFDLMAALVEQRRQALALMAARGVPLLLERRRRQRIDAGQADPADYQTQRREPPSGAILIVDKGGAFRDHVAKLVGARNLAIEWTDSAGAAIRLCDETPVSLVMINTAALGIDPYQLCASIKSLDGAERVAVVFLVGASFSYDCERARAAGVRGLLDKPVADRHLVAALKKLMSLS